VNFATQLTERRAVRGFLECSVNDDGNRLRWCNVERNTGNIADDLIRFKDGLNFANGSSNNKTTAH
jgi:hypothetical protein